jgi:hypothetical protein
MVLCGPCSNASIRVEQHAPEQQVIFLSILHSAESRLCIMNATTFLLKGGWRSTIPEE